ncbi:hypothetical protein HQ585_16035 [candidate division KSB1 bacterium]|nr:hypothetical protein [candidate division KSB1 bacterium]
MLCIKNGTILGSFIFIMAFALFLLMACEENPTEPDPEYPDVTREEKIPDDAVKMTPETDVYPPVLHLDAWENPVPLPGPVNTAGGEDSPFIPVDRDEFYFFFTPDVSVPAEQQVGDDVTGIYMSKYEEGNWQEPERIWLQDPGKLSLDGAEFIQGNEMLFVSAREGYTGLHWFSADYVDGAWTNWQKADFNSDYEVGELHIHENELYYHSAKAGGKGQYDIWKLTKVNGAWQNPVLVEILNSTETDGWPYVTPDGSELWFTRTYLGSPAVYRSIKSEGEWQEPELVLSQFAGEPTMDKFGNLYFVHHYFIDGVMIEADIYVCYKK